jgi:hypothetical protein
VGVGALSTALAATVVGFLHESPADVAEAKLEAAERRIATLEAEVERLQGEVRGRDDSPSLESAPPPPAPAPADTASSGGAAPSGDAVAERAKRIREAAEARAARAEEIARAELEVEARRERERQERERQFLEDAARGGTMALLRGLKKDGVRPLDLVASRDRFAALFERQGPGLTSKGFPADLNRPLEDGLTITLPSGVHPFPRRLASPSAFPKDLLVDGAGMDLTLLVLSGDISTNAEVRSLTFRDLTVDCHDNYFFDLRSEAPATIRLERCRVVGFDMGAGGSVMLAATTAAFSAVDCRIEAGYSRATAGFGNLFRVRSGLLARLEGCTLLGPFSSVFDANPHATYVFSRCRFEDLGPRRAIDLDRPPEGVRFEDCVVVPSPEGVPPHSQRRSLTAINPAWPAR